MADLWLHPGEDNMIWDQLTHFTPDEFKHPDEMSHQLLLKLDKARGIAGVPFEITSDFRSGDPRAHGRGTAVDIRVRSGRQRFKIVQALLLVGFKRIGVYDKHIHADIAGDTFPQEVLWIGESS